MQCRARFVVGSVERRLAICCYAFVHLKYPFTEKAYMNGLNGTPR